MNLGDIFWVEFPAGAGRAQSGRRPALIVQGSAASAKLPTVLLIPFTTQQDALRFPGTVFVDADANNGLRRGSVALVFQLTVLDQRFLGNRLGQVGASVLEAVGAAFDDIAERRPGT